MTNLYLGNKMNGVPYFNAPWFDEAANKLWDLPHVRNVFNPAQHDRDMGFDPMKCPNGSLEESRAAGFSLHEALAADWRWIALHSDAMIAGPDWYTSKGTTSEIACHQALGLPVYSYRLYLSWHEGYLFGPLKNYAFRPLLELGVPSTGFSDKLKVLAAQEEDDGLTCDC